VVDLLQGGQGVFGIAIVGAFKEVQGTLSDLPAERGESGAPEVASFPVAPAWPGVEDELAARRARRKAG
jgi:hypothetical protein